VRRQRHGALTGEDGRATPRLRLDPFAAFSYEPRQIDAIVDAELQRALDDPDPLRGIAQLVARWGAAFTLDPDGVTRSLSSPKCGSSRLRPCVSKSSSAPVDI
jgi:hypothetical protein